LAYVSQQAIGIGKDMNPADDNFLKVNIRGRPPMRVLRKGAISMKLQGSNEGRDDVWALEQKWSQIVRGLQIKLVIVFC